MVGDELLHTWSIFRELKLPVARKKGRLPIFLDLSMGSRTQESSIMQIIDELVLKSADIIDGIILSPLMLPSIARVNGKEIWIRSDNGSASLSQEGVEHKNYSLSQNPQEFAQAGVSGILGTLLLGNAASLEADNIQHLSLLRSRSSEVGLPFAIDLHISKDCSKDKTCVEIIELGLNLAVELGGDLAILPMLDGLIGNENIEKIAAIPILVRQSIRDVILEERAVEIQNFILEKTGGVVLTDLKECSMLFEESLLLEKWSVSMQLTPVGGE
jgi:hypothetical protein